jgi:hypothetical protein
MGGDDDRRRRVGAGVRTPDLTDFIDPLTGKVLETETP